MSNDSPTRLTAHRTPHARVGSCNFCDRYMPTRAGASTVPHDVTEVTRSSGGGIAVRFCDACLGELADHARPRPASGGKTMDAGRFLGVVLEMTHNALSVALSTATMVYGARDKRVGVLRCFGQVAVAMQNGQWADAREQLDKAITANMAADAGPTG